MTIETREAAGSVEDLEVPSEAGGDINATTAQGNENEEGDDADPDDGELEVDESDDDATVDSLENDG
jgi:hypothetical protein